MPSVRPFVLVVVAAVFTHTGCAAPLPAATHPAPTRPAATIDPIDTGEDTGLAHPR